jgi:hypothetical protein
VCRLLAHPALELSHRAAAGATRTQIDFSKREHADLRKSILRWACAEARAGNGKWVAQVIRAFNTEVRRQLDEGADPSDLAFLVPLLLAQWLAARRKSQDTDKSMSKLGLKLDSVNKTRNAPPPSRRVHRASSRSRLSRAALTARRAAAAARRQAACSAAASRQQQRV